MQEDIPSLPTKLFAALAKAQAKFPAIPKNREVEITMKSGGRYKFRYADLEMAMELASMLEGFERGHFPATEDAENNAAFYEDDAEHCIRAMELIRYTLQKGSLGRVVFGMRVLLDPQNEAVDHSCDYLERHPKVRMHDELVSALRGVLDLIDAPPDANCSCHINPPCSDCFEYGHVREALAGVRAALAKVEAS